MSNDYDPVDPHEVELLTLIDQEHYSYHLDHIHHPVNLTEGELIFEIPADIREWCLVLIGVDNGQNSSDCHQLAISQRPLVLNVLNASTGSPSNIAEYPSTFNHSLPLDLTDLADGSYVVTLSLKDWANNTHEESWPLAIDRTVPNVSWELDPVQGDVLGDHRQNLSWESSEAVSVIVTVNGVPQNGIFGTSGSLTFQLNRTGNHTACFFAVDLTSSTKV